MTVMTSSNFASSAHSGQNWREAAKAVLDDLTDVQSDEHDFTLGFVYVSDSLADDVGSILNLFRSVLGIKDWCGSVGIGVCGARAMYAGEPAIAAMITRLPKDDYAMLRLRDESFGQWAQTRDPMLVLTHAHPNEESSLMIDLKEIEAATSGFVVGGISLCRAENLPKTPIMEGAGVNITGGIDGVAFAADVPVVSMMSQGCVALGEPHTITDCDMQTIFTLGESSAQDAFENDLRGFAMDKIGKDPDTVVIDDGPLKGAFADVFKGEILAGFPLGNTDNGDLLVRPVLGINEDGSMAVQHHCFNNERVVFVHRSEETMAQDLSHELIALRKRIEKGHGPITPQTIQGGIYISCAARAFGEDGRSNTAEIDLIHDVLGDFPLCGFYSGGEIKGHRLYGYSGILTLFL